jgi:hypothetical protein
VPPFNAGFTVEGSINPYQSAQVQNRSQESSLSVHWQAGSEDHQTMTEEEVVKTIRDHLEGQFPKVCANCERCYTTFRMYLQNTTRLGSAMSYDAEIGDWKPLKPLGALTHSNCPCGSTLALSSAGMPLLRLWSLLNWARIETKKRNQTTEELLNYLREKICKQVLSEPD